MANQRGTDQTFVGVWIKQALAEKIERARRGPRSQFMRDAIAEYCIANGVPVEPDERQAADRVKPPAEPVKYPNLSRRHLQLNEPKLRKGKK